MQTLSIPDKPTEKRVSIIEGEHLIGEFIGDALGATLIVFGSVHGNESGGALALQKIAKILPQFASKLKGRVTTPIVRAPNSLAICATTGDAPVPVPPPMPQAMKIISAPRSTS